MIFGYSILGIWAALALTIGLGHVEERTSFGLSQVLIGLAGLSGGFAQWAFSKKGDSPSQGESKGS